MAEQKTKCSKCGAEILQMTASITGGLCMPCKTGSKVDRRDPNEPVEVSCAILSYVEPAPVLLCAAQDLLKSLDQTRHFGDSLHANKFELEAQRALLRHAVRYGVSLKLNDDHWGVTGSVILGLFEKGKATMMIRDKRLHFGDVLKEEWREGSEPLASQGGFLYRDLAGTIVHKQWTWVS